MKLILQWRDPDFYDGLQFDEEYQQLSEAEAEKVWELFKKLGVNSEQIDVEVDTEAGTATIIA